MADLGLFWVVLVHLGLRLAGLDLFGLFWAVLACFTSFGLCGLVLVGFGSF